MIIIIRNNGMRKINRFLCLVFTFCLFFAECVPCYAEVEYPDGRAEEFIQNGWGFYNPDGGDCYDSAGTGVVAGDELTDKVWNYFVTANIPGVSDNAAVIAGIMGNLQAESGFRPFAVGSGGYYGIFQCSLESCAGASEMVGAVNASGGSSYWGTDGAPDAIINKALKIELDFLSKYGRFETSEVGFIPNLDVPSKKTPEAYAELFLVAVEGAINGEPLEDGGVLNFAQSKYGYSTYQAASARRTFARQIYDKYGSKKVGKITEKNKSAGDGSDVTIIGDSITVGAEQALLEKLPEADIHAKVNKHFASDISDNDSGLTILKKLVEMKKLRDVLVFALGTNDAGGFGEENAEKVLELADGKTVIFVNNYTKSNDYTSNNNLFNKLANDNSNVILVDWKDEISSDVDKYLGGDGIHPNDEGRELFASLIADAINNTGGVGMDSCSESTNGQLYFWAQGEEPWGSMPYGKACGGDTIGNAGCGPTSLAMVITALTGKKVTPDVIANKADDEGYRVCGAGSMRNIGLLAREYGLNVEYEDPIDWSEDHITRLLKQGKMIQLASEGSNPFTNGGHFIAIRGITKSGKWLIFDSGHAENQEKEFSPSEILSAGTHVTGASVIWR